MVVASRKANPTHPDMYFYGQVLRTVKDNVLVEFYRDETGNECTRAITYVPLKSDGATLKKTAWRAPRAKEKLGDEIVYTSIKQTDVDPYGKISRRRPRIRKVVVHSGFGLHEGLEARLKERDKKRAGLEDDNSEDDDEEHDEAYISSISKKSILSMRQAGATRILRSGTNQRFPPTEMIAASSKEEGTYRYFDINQRVVEILNNFGAATNRQVKHVFDYTDTCAIQHLSGHISYTATIKWQRRTVYRPSRIGRNSFWETGYVGELEGVPYYCNEANARQAVSLRILVDFFTYKIENTEGILDPNHNWPKALMNRTTSGDNYVVLVEDRGGDKKDDHLFCIVIRHSDSCILLIPRQDDHKPWKEVKFEASNWSKKRPPSSDC